MDKKEFLQNMKDRGRIDKTRYDNAIVKIDTEKQIKSDYRANKSNMTDKQRIDMIEKILGI